jgi:hypothetical protein
MRGYVEIKHINPSRNVIGYKIYWVFFEPKDVLERRYEERNIPGPGLLIEKQDWIFLKAQNYMS